MRTWMGVIIKTKKKVNTVILLEMIIFLKIFPLDDLLSTSEREIRTLNSQVVITFYGTKELGRIV